MISTRLRAPSRSVAVLVRLVAFVVAATSVVLIPVAFASAATAHTSTTAAFETAGIAALLTLVTTLAARSLDPMRR